MTADFDMVINHPSIAHLGLDHLEQGRIGSFTVDLCHWLAGAPVHSLGLLARVTLMIVQDELQPVRERCMEQEEVTIEAAVAITGKLWPRLRAADESAPPSETPQANDGPVLSLLRECCGLDLPELLYLTQSLEAELRSERAPIAPVAAHLMEGIPQHTLECCDRIQRP